VFVQDVIAAIKIPPSGIKSPSCFHSFVIPSACKVEVGTNLCGLDGPAKERVTFYKSNLIVLAYVALSNWSAHNPFAFA
jgi:hypothetical protein